MFFFLILTQQFYPDVIIRLIIIGFKVLTHAYGLTVNISLQSNVFDNLLMYLLNYIYFDVVNREIKQMKIIKFIFIYLYQFYT